MCFYIEDGKAYLQFLADWDAGVGLTIPDVIYDPDDDVSGVFAGINEDELGQIRFTHTIYGELGGVVDTYCTEQGFCFAGLDPQTTLAGDVTGDGLVTLSDAWTLLRWLAEGKGMHMTERAYANADMNGDGIADMLDVRAILETVNSTAVG